MLHQNRRGFSAVELFVTMSLVILTVMVAVITYNINIPEISRIETRPSEEQVNLEKRQSGVKQLVNEISYFRDPRTGLCFACRSKDEGLTYGTFSMTVVPCEKVPSSLLLDVTLNTGTTATK